MTSTSPGRGLLRAERPDGHRVTPLELFFDLVYVFAVTQLSHLLLEHLTLHGAFQTLLLLLAVWWAWIDTAWVTNWFDPDRRAVRLMLVGVMLASLIVSAAIPQAFGQHGLLFAAAYVATQVGRSLFCVAALGGAPAMRLNFQRILTWAAGSGLIWIAGVKRAAFGSYSVSRLAAMAALVLIAPLGLIGTPLVLAGASTAVLAGVALYDSRASWRLQPIEVEDEEAAREPSAV